jgi:predicted metal-binding protein
MENKTYVVIVQCHLVMQRCSGFFCEKAFHERIGGFAGYDKDQPLRVVNMTCGGCCGRALHRKLGNLVRKAQAKDGVGKEQIVVHLSSCITKDNYHGPPCPHLGYLKALVAKLGLVVREDTSPEKRAEQRRADGVYGGG